mmetsp:Transcript_19487/g.39415  ORF Transcript_19487/g.39415 Transcript_19487/m.39415 type:complete len:228 (-) Transcript_19487:1062-1745(-)
MYQYRWPMFVRSFVLLCGFVLTSPTPPFFSALPSSAQSTKNTLPPHSPPPSRGSHTRSFLSWLALDKRLVDRFKSLLLVLHVNHHRHVDLVGTLCDHLNVDASFTQTREHHSRQSAHGSHALPNRTDNRPFFAHRHGSDVIEIFSEFLDLLLGHSLVDREGQVDQGSGDQVHLDAVLCGSREDIAHERSGSQFLVGSDVEHRDALLRRNRQDSGGWVRSSCIDYRSL